MTSSRFDPGSTSKTLNLSLLWFNEWSRSENLDVREAIRNMFLLLGFPNENLTHPTYSNGGSKGKAPKLDEGD